MQIAHQAELTARLKFLFRDDGIVPNTGLPVLLYPGAVEFDIHEDADTASAALDAYVEKNGWHFDWKGSVYRRTHYHSTAHELLVVWSGNASLKIGGDRLGEVIRVRRGSALIIPAGVGHKRLDSSKDFLVLGFYPDGQDWDLCWGWERERGAAFRNLKNVGLPLTDPIYGREGLLMFEWKK